MTAGSLLTILFYIWLAITAVGALVWYRRRSKRQSRQADARPATVGNRNRGDRFGSEGSPGSDTAVGSAVAASGADLGIDAEDPTVDRPPNLNEFLTSGEPEYGADDHDFTGTDLYDQGNGVDLELETVNNGFYTDGDELLDDGLTVHDLPQDYPADHDEDYPADHDEDYPADHDEDYPADHDEDYPADHDADYPADHDADYPADHDAAEAEFEAGFDHDNGVDDQVDDTADEYSTDNHTADEYSTDNQTADEYSTDNQTADEYTAGNHVALGSLPNHEQQSTADLGRLLSEFDLPYDLAPLGGDDAPDPNGHVTLVSEHADAAEVGTALADELVELGYEFEPVGHDRGLAKRGADVIALRITPNLASSDASDQYRSSGLADSAVVVEMWSGQSNPDGFEDF